MTYSNDPKWRKFMDAKWKEMEQNRMKPSTSDMLIHSSHPNYILEHLKKKEEKPISPVHAKPKATPVHAKPTTNKASGIGVKRPVQQAARTGAHGAAPRILDQIKSMPEKVVKKPTIADMGARRRTIGSMQNPTVHELREYHELSNKIEKELTDRQVKLNEDWKKS